MTPTHRPLSPWTTRWPLSDTEPVVVNDGHDRMDARDLPTFREGWHRAAIRLKGAETGLGLIHDDGTSVVELDDFGRPIAATDAEVRVVSLLEEHWPAAESITPDQLAQLGNSSLPLRFWLVERLRGEGDPVDEVFSMLPWDLLERATRTVMDSLVSEQSVGEIVEIGHWLSPAILGPPAALEQLDHGLRFGEPDTARSGASALLTSLRNMSLRRVPDRTCEQLLQLVEVLATVEPQYAHLARVIAARFRRSGPVPRLRTTLDSRLAAAASGEDDRRISMILGVAPHRLLLEETAAGRLELTVQVPAASRFDTPLGHQVDAFLPVHVISEGSSDVSTYWIALELEEDYLIGELIFLLPRGVSTVDAEDTPVGAADLTSASVEDLLPSLYISTGPTVDRWRQIADALPSYHPVRKTVEAYEAHS